ncbi:MAG: TetR family transcriptional regulator [Acidobacteriia bacterium]|nr:TetR family transcriptional regulator [Terriglobia bacterium]
MIDTKTRILDAAERLLSERGFAATSLRGITAAAGVNLGAVNYHFRSKEALIHSVFARRLEPLNRKRLAALDACEAEASGQPVPLEKLLRAFLDPMLRPDRDGKMFMQLLGRMYSEPALDIQRIFTAELRPVVQRFTRAFRRTLPELDAEDLFWRLFFTIGAMAHTLAAGSLLKFLSGGICDPSDMEDAERRLVRFTGAGLGVPPERHGKGRTKGMRLKKGTCRIPPPQAAQ